MHGQGLVDLLTVAEVAALLNVRPRTVYELVRTRRIPNRTLGGRLLFPRALVELWVAQFPRLRPLTRICPRHPWSLLAATIRCWSGARVNREAVSSFAGTATSPASTTCLPGRRLRARSI